MKQQRVYINYSKMSDSALATLTGRTVAFLTDNANFPELPMEIAAYTVLAGDYRNKLELAVRSGGRLEVTAKNNARRDLLETMRRQAFYVNGQSDGDAHKLAGSGFILVDPPQRLRRPFPPLIVRLLDDGRKGELRLQFEVVTNAWEYEYEIAHAKDANGDLLWGSRLSTTNTRENTIEGLSEGQRYHVHVRARNGRGLSDWGHTVSLIAR